MLTLTQLKEVKRELGLTNEDVAEITGVSLSTIQKVFGGTVKSPRWKTLKALSGPLEELQRKMEILDQEEKNWPEDLKLRDSGAENPGEFRETAFQYSPYSADGKKGETAAVVNRFGGRTKLNGEYTVEDFFAWPEEEYIELIDGRIYNLPTPRIVHQAIAGEIIRQMFDCQKEHNIDCRVYFAPVGVQLDKDNRTIVVPDILILCDEAKIMDRYVFGAPDFVLEILSPSTRSKDLILKNSKYYNAGCREYWIVDPEKEEVIVHDYENEELDIRYTFDDQIPVRISGGKCLIDFAEIRVRIGNQREELRRQVAEKKQKEEWKLDYPEIEDAQITSCIAETPFSYQAQGNRHITPRYYLKWQDDVVGEIDEGFRLYWTQPEYNETVQLYSGGDRFWDSQKFLRFLEDRIVSPSRRDIEQILHRCGLVEYDTLRITLATRGICARDLLWIAEAADEEFDDSITDVFRNIFLQSVDSQGDSIDTPEGQNIKRYGVFQGSYGIFKKRLTPLSTDIESELAVAALAQRLGIPVCRCDRVDQDTVFSFFHYDFGKDYIVHFRRLIRRREHASEFQNLLAARPQYLAEFVRMIALDLITRQDDRHLSNIAVKITGHVETFYPLYDNGRSLFYEDTEETVDKACADPTLFMPAFGPEGTVLDCAKEISAAGIRFGNLLNLDLADTDISQILTDAGLTGYRRRGAEIWIRQMLDLLREMDGSRHNL